MNDDLGFQLAIAAACGYLVRWAKRSESIPWLKPYSLGRIRWIAILAQMATAAGIHFTFDGTMNEAWSLTIGGPAVAHMVNGFVGYAIQQQVANHQPAAHGGPMPPDFKPNDTGPLSLVKG